MTRATTAARVNVLPESVANKIAAGEVVQRPESVAKELLENALDAGATRIAVTVRDGGVAFLQVADNGSGMDARDAVTAFQRHATSKISTVEDLESIRTYGFRGEALAAIGAVARVTLVTRRAEDEVATSVRIEGGGHPHEEAATREPGTTVTVQQLFFNVPARRKFLKSTTTEYRHLAEAVQRVALARPDVVFTFTNDGAPVLQLREADLSRRILELFGERQRQGLLPLEGASGPFRISGFIGKPEFGQRSRARQYLFLNTRFVVNRAVNHAVQSGYEHLLAPGVFPFFVIFLEIDPSRVDVNVHPAKLEVKFEDEQLVYRTVQSAVRAVLAAGTGIPALDITPPGVPGASSGLRFTGRQHAGGSFIDPSTGEVRQLDGLGAAHSLLAGPLRSGEDDAGKMPEDTGPDPQGTARALWQIQNTYILAQATDGFLIIDQHVAHERVLYEEVRGRMDRSDSAGQQLLFPRVIELSPADRVLVGELEPSLRDLGFSFGPFGGASLLIDAAPPELMPGSEEAALKEILDRYREYQRVSPESQMDMVAKAYSCRAAVKAGDVLSDPEMETLVGRLFRTTMPYVCPHGRPVVLRITMDELNRRFGRT